MRAAKYLLLVSLLFSPFYAQACNRLIQNFPRDCAIQDRFLRIKNYYATNEIDIDEIAEYRVIRFVDRYNWERAKAARVKPENIYQPSPATWSVWDAGTREISHRAVEKNSLFQNNSIDEVSISFFNRSLLMSDQLGLNVKDKLTDGTLQPGEFRKETSNGVGFRAESNRSTDYQKIINQSEESMVRFQQRWENLMGASFSQMLQQAGVAASDGASLKSHMKYDGNMNFVLYAPSTYVPSEIQWIKNFIRLNLEKYKDGNPQLSPIELATAVQKWFVSIHPFADGNGRTSRAVQDVILGHFEMPFIPGGDLQEDATTVYEDYLELTYKKTEALLSALELCQTRNAGAFQCQTVQQIGARADADSTGSNFKQASPRRD